MRQAVRLLGTVVAVLAVLAVALGVARWGVGAASVPDDDRSATVLVGGSAAVPEGPGWAAWGARPDGSPLRWNPCRPIEWVVRPDDPAWLVELADEAFQEVGAHAGLEFRHVGRRATGIGAEQRTASSGDWAPVVVTLTSTREVDWLTRDDRALAVPVVVDGVFVTGQVLLDRDASLATDFSSRDGSWGATLLHEASHLVGLDHVDDPDQLLYPYPLPGEARLGAGDVRGLAALGGDRACLDPGPVTDLAVDTPRRR